MDAATQHRVRRRAGDCCEYCRLPQAVSPLPFEIDHVIARKHGGPDDFDNLCLACFSCNNAKGPDLCGIDPQSGAIAALFHPRRQRWARHFRWDGAVLIGRTKTGRATVAVLQINREDRVAQRRALIAEGVFPPPF
ncbi:MAG TPA: HNH endonuclease signature motif containing protein [Gemmataceae bacterium]|nr:HNH endonuclease signature motif containing protein [Gemmataceae bacterium]